VVFTPKLTACKNYRSRNSSSGFVANSLIGLRTTPKKVDRYRALTPFLSGWSSRRADYVAPDYRKRPFSADPSPTGNFFRGGGVLALKPTTPKAAK
jgi:hypothetical protein